MQRLWALAVLLLGAVAPSTAVRLQAGLSPVTRVVTLLQGLGESIEKEGKKEEELYENFVCWAKSIVSQKTESNSAAESRIDMLATYLADLDAGRIELTTERKDLEKEISTLTTEIETATAQRNKEKEDFEEAKAEMDQAIKALDDGIEVLKTATEGHENGVLLGLKGQISEGFAARTREAASLNRAVQLGQKVLSRGDSVFLRRLLTGDVPNVDWKKLNRKATFKSSYKARSGKIQETLAKLLEQFTSNLQEATKKEAAASALFDKLMGTKGDQKSAAQDALQRMDSENGAKGMSRMESQDEHDKLKEQVKDDTAYIQQVEKSLAEKKEEWKDRQTLRSAELAAISKAVSILRSDDARDTFKKSFKSQDKAFLQVKEGSLSLSQRGAFEALKQAAANSHDARLAALAMTLRAGSHFDEVIGAIDKMVAVLKAEEAADLEKKEDCEKDNAENTRKAVLASRSIDEMSDAIKVLQGEIKDLEAEVKDKQEKVKEIETQLVDAKKVRDDEHAEYKVAKKEDQDAKELVKSAAAVLAGFYKDNNLALVQHAKKQPFTSEAGSAPPPPPATWEAPYGGKTGESQGIVAILGMVEDDIAKDIAKADAEEKESLDMYTETKAALESEKENLNGQISEMTGTISSKEIDVSDTKGERSTKKGELDSVLKSIADSKSYCEFFTVNYPLRLKNRQVEIDGLNKAKTILKGGSFTAPADPDREMKPGDALLQRKRSGH